MLYLFDIHYILLLLLIRLKLHYLTFHCFLWGLFLCLLVFRHFNLFQKKSFGCSEKVTLCRFTQNRLVAWCLNRLSTPHVDLSAIGALCKRKYHALYTCFLAINTNLFINTHTPKTQNQTAVIKHRLIVY